MKRYQYLWWCVTHFLVPGAVLASSLESGQSVSGYLATDEQIDVYSFPAQSGRAYVSMADTSTGGEVAPIISIVDPTNNVAGQDFDPGVARQALNTIEGIYTVSIFDSDVISGNGIGSYDLHFVQIPGTTEGGHLSANITIEDTLTAGDMDSWLYYAVAGERFTVTMDSSGPGYEVAPNIKIVAHDSSVLRDSSDPSSKSISIVAANSGLYTIIATNSDAFSGSGIGPYSLSLTTSRSEEDTPFGEQQQGTLEDTQSSSQFIGPLPYSSFNNPLSGANTSPFVGSQFTYFHLEDFEDGLLNTPGVSVREFATTDINISFSDSVDGDDGVIDGRATGNARSLFSNLRVSSFTFDFDQNALNGYPTHAGIVWTDIGRNNGGTPFTSDLVNNTMFEAFDAAGSSIGVVGPVSLGDSVINRTTDEDRFFGLIHSGGISAIKISMPGKNNWEVDHLQYGRIPFEQSCNGLPVDVFIGNGDLPSSGADVILGTDGNDIINGLGGDDTICGLGGNDIINAGNGNDWVDAGPGNDTVQGGNGNDEIYGDSGVDIINGGPHDDELYGESDGDFINGNSGNDLLDGGFGVDQLRGGSGNDVINTGSGGNRGTGLVVTGGAGNDIITGGRGNDEIRGEAGNDTILGGDAGDSLFGGGGNDIVNGQNGNDILRGNGSKDTVIGGDGNDDMDGGDSDDIMSGGDGNDVMRGSTGNDEMSGGAGDDQIFGGGGNDILNGNRGDDELSGGGSNDALNGGSDTDSCSGDGGVDTAASCESQAGIP